MKIELSKYFQGEAMKHAASTRSRIITTSLPFIIQNEIKGFTLVYSLNSLVYLQDKEGSRYKVVTNRSRSKKELKKEKVDKLLFVKINEDFTASITKLDI